MQIMGVLRGALGKTGRDRRACDTNARPQLRETAAKALPRRKPVSI